MEKLIGSTRIVFLFEKFVLKVPVIEFRGAITQLISNILRAPRAIKQVGWKKYRVIRKKYAQIKKEKIAEIGRKNYAKKYERQGTWEILFFGGIMSNWNEYLFWLKTKDALLCPTYFSLLGLINFQKRVLKLEATEKEFETEMEIALEKDGKRKAWADHAISNPRNFGNNEGILVIVDYGDRKTQALIKKYGEGLKKMFNKKGS